MKSVYPHIIPEIEDWPIYKVSRNRSAYVAELQQFSFNRMMDLHAHEIEDMVAKTIYLEKIRCKNIPWKVDPPDEIGYWNQLEREFQSCKSEEEQIEILRRIVHRYSEEITGSFNPKTFKFARRFLTSFFKRLLNTAAGRNHRRIWGNRYQLQDRIMVTGYVDEFRSLFSKGTVVVVPTHFSNLDSILIGYAMDAVVGVPAFAYGAGLNLYEVELIAYFMNRLGAYKVDRRKKNPIYLECLKSMACYSLEKGVNNLFFPGGTRSRTGAIESRLKLGLLGSVMETQRHFIQNGEDKKIFIVPIIMSYHFVLEAKYLIDQHLRLTTKEKYVKSRDQYTSYRKIMKFVWSLFSEKSKITISVGEPLDVLGNKVDGDGNSVDKYGEIIDLKKYFLLNETVTTDHQRETVYTKMLGDKILESYYRNNVVLSSHLVAFVAYRLFLNTKKDLPFEDFINLDTSSFHVSLEYFFQVLEKLKEKLLIMKEKGEIRLSETILFENVPEMALYGIKNLGIYHIAKPLKIQGEILTTEDIRLLYFYHNRMEHYQLEKVLEEVKLINSVTAG